MNFTEIFQITAAVYLAGLLIYAVYKVTRPEQKTLKK